MDDIIKVVELVEEKERQKEIQEEMEKAELREQLRWVLQKLHEKNITYKAEDEYQEGSTDPHMTRGWFSRLFSKKDDPEP